MPTLSVETVRADGVTFVEVLVDAERPHRVRIENRLAGPVWPPRADGRPVEGWDSDGVSTTVGIGTTPLGFATFAPPEEPAVELVKSEAVEPAGVPAGVDAWLRRVECRVERAERLAAVQDVPAAAEAVERAGGLAGVERLAATVDRDRRAASRLSFVPDGLARRLDAVDIPTEALARLATR